jgi:hypothetical protein
VFVPLAAVVLAACTRTVAAHHASESIRRTPADSVDFLIARALTVPGEFLETTSTVGYAFTADSALEPFAQLPSALPTLVGCLGRDALAKATWAQAPVRVGVICYQAMLRTAYVQRLIDRLPTGLPDLAWVDYRSTLEELRLAQGWWQNQLQRQPPS